MAGLKRTAVMGVLVVLSMMACGLADQSGNLLAGEPKEQLGVPDALKGFRGMLVGVIAKKGKQEFIIEVEKITRTWKANKAENPQDAVGKKAVCELWPKGRLYQKQLQTLAELKAGDRVVVEPFHLEPEHDHLTVVEALHKAD